MRPLKTFIPRLIAALILLQVAGFKFAGAAESVTLFEQLGAEPLGRYATAGIELVAAVLLLVPKTRALGALLTLAVMGGAIGTHLAKLGVELIGPDGTGDGGTMFVMAIVTALCSAFVLFVHRGELPLAGEKATASPVTGS